MKNKFLKPIITFAVLLSLACTSVTVHAHTIPEKFADNQGNGARIITEKPTQPEETTTAATTTEAPTTTAAPTTTRVYTTQSAPSYTTRPATQPASADEDVTEAEAEEETEEETTLPDGQFYVYLDMCNDTEIQKWLMEKPGLVPEPKKPVREGYIFDGWYSDKKLTKEWDFSKNKAKKEMTFYAKWSLDVSAMLFNISVVQTDGGKITVSSDSAKPGTPVTVGVSPADGKRIVEGSLTINGVSSDVYTFTMPEEDVVIEARFEDVPQVAVEEEDNSFILIIAVAGAIVLGLVIIGVVVIKRRNQIVVPEFDENGAVIIDDDEETWVDHSLVIESAFPDKVNDEKPEADDSFTAPAIKPSVKKAESDIPPSERTMGMKNIAYEKAGEETPLVNDDSEQTEDNTVADIPIGKMFASVVPEADTEEPEDVIEEPEVIAEPEVIEEPEVVEEPKATEEPEDVIEAEVVEDAQVTEEKAQFRQSAFKNPPAVKRIINENSSTEILVDEPTDVFDEVVENIEEDVVAVEEPKGKKRITIDDIDFSLFE